MTDNYQGRSGLLAPVRFYNFKNAYAVVVSGSGINVCGHLLLNIDEYYFHAARVHSYPLMMDLAEYERYLKANNKKELYREKINVYNSTGATNKLNELLKSTWLWGGLLNNCVHFVEEVVQAGGSNFGLLSNCPVMLRD